jgi:hypothetical protein
MNYSRLLNMPLVQNVYSCKYFWLYRGGLLWIMTRMGPGVRNGAGTPFVAFCSPTFFVPMKLLRSFSVRAQKNVANLLSLGEKPP